VAEAERGAASAAFLDAAPTSYTAACWMGCRWLWRCLIGLISREAPRLTQAPPTVLKELKAVRSLTETSSASPPPGLDTAFGVWAGRRGSLKDQRLSGGDVLKALACLEFCSGAGKYSKLTNDAKKVESSIVDEAYCSCSEAKELEEWRLPSGEFSCSRKLKRYEGVEVVEGRRCRRCLDNLNLRAFEFLADAPGYRWRCNKKWAYAGGAAS
jgi:hypothetical protein